MVFAIILVPPTLSNANRAFCKNPECERPAMGFRVGALQGHSVNSSTRGHCLLTPRQRLLQGSLEITLVGLDELVHSPITSSTVIAGPSLNRGQAVGARSVYTGRAPFSSTTANKSASVRPLGSSRHRPNLFRCPRSECRSSKMMSAHGTPDPGRNLSNQKPDC